MKMNEVRRFAMSLPEVSEAPHHDFGSFRVRGKIFTIMPPGNEFIPMFIPEPARERAPAAYSAFVEKLLRGGKVLGVRVALAGAEAGVGKRPIREAWESKARKSLVGTAQRDQEQGRNGPARASHLLLRHLHSSDQGEPKCT